MLLPIWLKILSGILRGVLVGEELPLERALFLSSSAIAILLLLLLLLRSAIDVLKERTEMAERLILDIKNDISCMCVNLILAVEAIRYKKKKTERNQ